MRYGYRSKALSGLNKNVLGFLVNVLRQWCIDYFALTKCHPGAVVLILEVYVCDHDYYCLGIYAFYIELAELQFRMSDQNSDQESHTDKTRALLTISIF